MKNLLVLARSNETSAAVVSSEDVKRHFYADFATQESGRYYWWCRLVLLEPNELIVDDGNDVLYRVPFSINGTEVTFGEPVEVVMDFQDVPVTAAEVAASICDGIVMARGPRVKMQFKSREESGARPLRSQEGQSMTFIERLRAKLKLSADVPDEEVERLAEEALAEESGENAGGEGEGGAGAAPDGSEDGQEQSDEGTPAAPATPEAQAGAVTVDAAALRQLQADAKAGREANERLLKADDDRILDEAVSKGKFPPSRREHYAKALANSVTRESTLEAIKALAEDLVPVTQRSKAATEEVSGNGQPYPPGLLPDVDALKARMAKVASGDARRPRVMSDR